MGGMAQHVAVPLPQAMSWQQGRTDLARKAVAIAGCILLASDQADAITHRENDHIDVGIRHDSLVEGPNGFATLAWLPAVGLALPRNTQVMGLQTFKNSCSL